MNMQTTKDEVLTLWHSLEESKGWTEVEWISQCTTRPEWVLLGSHTTGELFALLDIQQPRVIPEEEIGSPEIEELEWESVYYVPTFKDAAKLYKKAACADFEKPDKTASSRKGEAWLLNAADKTLLAVVQDGGHVMHGAALNAWSRQLMMGIPGPIQNNKDGAVPNVGRKAAAPAR